MASAMRDSSPPEATLPTGRGVLPAVARHQEFGLFQAVLSGLFELCQRYVEHAALHAQALHGLGDGLGELRRGLAAGLGYLAGFFEIGRLGRGFVLFKLGQVGRGIELCSSACQDASSSGSSAGVRL